MVSRSGVGEGGAGALIAAPRGGDVCDTLSRCRTIREKTTGSRYRDAQRCDIYDSKLAFVPGVAVKVSGKKAAKSRCHMEGGVFGVATPTGRFLPPT